jgi:uncharacterized membrane protein YbhN (UPF0104 family)
LSAIETPAPASPRPVPSQAAEPAPPADPAPRRGSRASWIGAAVSVLALAGVVYWAARQPAPRLPQTAGEWLAVAGAVLLYAAATLVRGERWQRLLRDEGGTPPRRVTQELNVIGYMANNILPARAGDAVRVVLMTPRAGGIPMRSVIGTLLAERVLDVALLLVVFVVVGWGLLGEVGSDKVELVLLGAAGLALAAGLAYLVLRRNQRVHDFFVPLLSSTLNLRRAHHGLRLLGLTLLIWAIEAGVWMASAAGVGFGMTPIEGLYIVALASVFAMIPSGPAYAGTLDAASILGIKALGASSAQAVAYVVMLRFVIVVPLTLAGLALLVTRYGGLGKLRTARA